MNLRDKVIKLAHENPELREHLLPLIKEGARTSSPKVLAKALLKYLAEIQKWEGKELGPEWGKGGKYDPVADTGVWVGKQEVARYTKSHADVVLHYDGAGHDYFTHNTGLRQYRKKVKEIAKRYGYYIEDLNNWSLGFYQND